MTDLFDSGGAEVLMTVAGADGTEGFNDIGHSKEAKEQLEGLVIGAVEGAKTMTVVVGSASSCSTKSIVLTTHYRKRLNLRGYRKLRRLSRQHRQH